MHVADLLNRIDERIPFMAAAPWDPVGLQLGRPGQEVSKVGVCHEMTAGAVDGAIASACDTIVAYHPLLFTPIGALVDDGGVGGRLLRLAESGISLIVVHTALDAAPEGTGDAFIRAMGMEPVASFGAEPVGGSTEPEIGRVAILPEPMARRDLATLVAGTIGGGVRTTSTEGKVSRIAVVPGSGGSFVRAASSVADALVTGDVSHHRAREADDRDLFLIDAGHVATERPGVTALYSAILGIVPETVLIDADPTPWEG
jgi:dinuclear metal center YbgI/SA1388 family protein